MPSLFAKSELFDLIDKVKKAERLDRDDAVRLMNSQDILALGTMANIIRERKNGHQTYYSLKGPSNEIVITDATMLYGNLKSREEQIDHLLQLRALQDQTNEFLSFTPLSCDPEDKELEETMGSRTSTGLEDLKALAISRILLDNFVHIKASSLILGLKLTQVSLAFGADYIVGNGVSKKAMIHLIQKAGRVMVESDGLGGSQ